MKRSCLPALLLAVSSLSFLSSCDDDKEEIVPPIPNQSFTQEFDNMGTATGAGWTFSNKSEPLGTSSWAIVTSPAAFSGTGFLTSDYNATAGAGIISNWAISPLVTMQNGDKIEFYAISANDNTDPAGVYPDRVQLLVSKTGEVNIGTGTDKGSFEAIVDINAFYDNTPPIAFPDSWTKFVGTISGLNQPVEGRFAIRYFVENGGPAGINSAAIGIDKVSYIGRD